MLYRVRLELGNVLVEVLGRFSVQLVRLRGRVLRRQAVFLVLVHVGVPADGDVVQALHHVLGGLAAGGVALGVVLRLQLGVVVLDFVNVVPTLSLHGLAAFVTAHDSGLGGGQGAHHFVFGLYHFDEDVGHWF